MLGRSRSGPIISREPLSIPSSSPQAHLPTTLVFRRSLLLLGRPFTRCMQPQTRRGSSRPPGPVGLLALLEDGTLLSVYRKGSIPCSSCRCAMLA